jgi:Protein of unknown function (DUF4242)
VETYVIMRRNGWRNPESFDAAAFASMSEVERTPDDIAWIRSYVLAEPDGTLGSVCIYEASTPEAVRSHALRAGLPIDEIVKVADTIVVRPDSAAEAA